MNGAIYLGRQDQIGSIAAGKNADLVLIKGDPATRISDIEKVEMVFKDGVDYDSRKPVDSTKGRYGPILTVIGRTQAWPKSTANSGCLSITSDGFRPRSGSTHKSALRARRILGGGRELDSDREAAKLHMGYAAVRISSKLNGGTSRFAILDAYGGIHCWALAIRADRWPATPPAC